MIHQLQYDESIWIVNPNGTRTVTSDEFRYIRIVLSTQDMGRTTDYHNESDLVRNYQWKLGESGKQLIPLLDAEGHETGAALFKERVTVEWVWQKHPNPVKITSSDHTSVNQQAGPLLSPPTGYEPFCFSVDVSLPAPVDAASGQMTIPPVLMRGLTFFRSRQRNTDRLGSSVLSRIHMREMRLRRRTFRLSR